MNTNLELYKTFYHVAKNGNITKAANELIVSQPAVSKSIKTLEEQLNTTLFNSINPDKNYILINIDNGWVYKNNDIIRNTDIRNGTRLILV